MVGVAQLVRVPDCDSGCRGFESHRPPHLQRGLQVLNGPLAQLVEQLTLNQLVEGSNPSRPTTSRDLRLRRSLFLWRDIPGYRSVEARQRLKTLLVRGVARP